MIRQEKLPRGVFRRGDSIGVRFALPSGKIERRMLGPVTPKFAASQREIFKREVAEGRYAKRQPTVIYTVANLFEPYMLDFINRGGRDPRRWRLAWKHLGPMFGRVPVGCVTTSKINEYISARKAAGRSNGTINRELTLLKAMFRFGAKQTPVMVDRIPAFPTRLKESAPRKGFVSNREYARLAANAKELWLRALIACAYAFGFRKGELLNLRVRQVDLIDRWVVLEVGATKNGEGRRVRMTSEVFELIRACVTGKKPDDFVFTREDGSRVVDPRKAWYDLCVRSGLGELIPVKSRKHKFNRYVGLNLHDFRRSAVRNLVRAGVPERVAMDISGHKTRSVFDRYNIVNEADLIRASELIVAGRQAPEEVKITDTKTDTSAFAVS
jgi:integrase